MAAGRGNREMQRRPREKLGSVLFGQQQRGHRAVGFGDDPELLGLGDGIAAHQAVPIFEAQFVLRLVLLAQISPIATKVTGKEFKR
jgi:hypothetical protein